MKLPALTLACLLSLTVYAQISPVNLAIVPDFANVSTYPDGLSKFTSDPKDCGRDTLRYAYYKALGDTLKAIRVSQGYAVGQYFDAPGDIKISGVTIYAYALYNSDDSVLLKVNLYRAGSDTLPTGAPIRSTTVWVDTVAGSITLNDLPHVLSFDSGYVANHPFIITIESSDSVGAAVISNNYVTGNGLRENIACATVGGTWYNCLNLNIGGKVLDCDFLIEPHVDYEIHSDFSFVDCYTPGDSFQLINNSSPVLYHRMYNRLFYSNFMEFSFYWYFTTGAVYDINPKYMYQTAQNRNIRLISRVYGYKNFSYCADTSYYDIHYKPSTPLLKADTPICSGNQGIITAASNGTVNWYRFFTDTSKLHTGNTYVTDTLYSNYLVMAEAENSGCLSERKAILVPVAKNPSNPQVIHDSVCLNARANLVAMVDAGKAVWWDDSTLGGEIYSGTVYQTDTLDSSLTLYVQADNRGCLSPNRIPVTANVSTNNAPKAPLLPPDTVICLHGEVPVFIASNGKGDETRWYNTASGGIPVLLGDSFEYSPVSVGEAFIYIDAFDGQCASSRLGFRVSTQTFPTVSIDAADTFCLGDTANFDYSVQEGSIRWYDSTVGGNLIHDGGLISLSGLTLSTTYYLQPYLGQCLDTQRHSLTIDVLPFGSMSNLSGDEVCFGEEATLSASTDAGAVIWSMDPEMDSIYGTGNTYTTDPLSSGLIYYAATLNHGCMSASQPVGILVNPLPNPGYTYQVQSPGQFSFQAVATGVNYAWDFDDGNTASSRLVNHRYYENDEYRVKLSTTSAKGCSDSSFRIIKVNGLLGLDLPGSNDLLILYPNPNEGRFTIESSINHETPLILYAPDGKQVRQINLVRGTNVLDLMEYGLVAGIYTALIITDKGVLVYRIAIQP